MFPSNIVSEIVGKNLIFRERNKKIYLKRKIPQILKDRLIFEKDRIRRLKEHYIYDYEEAFKTAQSEIKDLTEEEFEYLKDERYSDWIYIDGKVIFHRAFMRNIINVNMDLKSRFLNPKVDDYGYLDNTIKKTIEEGQVKFFIQAKTTLKLNKEFTRKDQKVKAHLPIPRSADQMKNIKILKTSHQAKFISRENHPQRTIYFEEYVKEDEEFSVEYSYESHIKYKNPSANMVASQQATFHTGEEGPHIRFTPYLKELTAMIIGDESNPLLKARRIYDYITQNVRYSFVRQYAAITNIGEYGAYNLKGDCGVQALLFINLCRIAKVPARWQSGLIIEPKFIGCHDWAEFYVDPYGWLPVDLSYGGTAYRKNSQLRLDYFFGNLDPFRMIANSEFHYGIYPEKNHLRYDPYDNQEGELEYEDRPILRHEFDVIKEIIEVREID